MLSRSSGKSNHATSSSLLGKRHSRNLVLIAGTDVDENGHPVCVKMYDRDEIGKWYTHPCDHQAQYVCEYNRIGHDNPDPPTTMDPTVRLSLSLSKGQSFNDVR